MTNDKEVLLKALEYTVESLTALELEHLLIELSKKYYVDLASNLIDAECAVKLQRDMDARIEEYRNRQS